MQEKEKYPGWQEVHGKGEMIVKIFSREREKRQRKRAAGKVKIIGAH